MKRQFTWAVLYRAAAIAGDPAVIAHISHIGFRKIGSGGATRGAAYNRNFILDNGHGVIEEQVDLQLKPNWDPRRFAHGHGNFVWKSRAGAMTRSEPIDLYGIIKVWPKQGSRRGKILDEVMPKRLSWSEMKARMSSLCRVSINGGIDPVFMECILASQMAKTSIELRGQD